MGGMEPAFFSPWMTAHAGSGKTTALTKRVLRLLIWGVTPERIVCITYTKAAASEMRQRIADRLRELMVADPARLEALVKDYLDATPTPEQIERARRLFVKVIDSPSGGVTLTTTHGFCQSILRRFPLEAEISPHFTVMDDREADAVLDRIKHEILSLEDSHSPALNALQRLSISSGEHAFDALLKDVRARRNFWMTLLRHETDASLRALLLTAHGLPIDADETQLLAAFAGMVTDAMRQTLREGLPRLSSQKSQKYHAWAELLAQWLEAGGQISAEWFDRLVDTFLTKEGNSKATFDSKAFPPDCALRRAITDLAEGLAETNRHRVALACAEESFAVAVIARAVTELYRQEKLAAQMLDYDDLIEKTLALMAIPERLGWVMRALDHRIDHLLVDEAQDNSADQWMLVKTLTEDLIASDDGRGSGGVPRSILVVGDKKQSIYSFQGAEPSLFNRYRHQLGRILEDTRAPLCEVPLTSSYRSAPAILRLVDTVCADTKIALALGAQDAPIAHQCIKKHLSGSITLHPLIVSDSASAKTAYTMPVEIPDSIRVSQRLAENIAQTVAPMLAAPYHYQPGEILILVQKRGSLVTPIIAALERCGIPVAGIDRLILSDHLAVRDFMALMRWCLHPGDDLALAQVLRSPIIGISEDALCTLAHGRTQSLRTVVHHPWLEALREASQYQTPYAFLSEVLDIAQKRRAFIARFGPEVEEVLDELKEQAATMPHDMPKTLTAFYPWISKNTRSIKRDQEPADPSRIRVMTVHGAKGLEAKCILLADAQHIPNTSKERAFSLTLPAGKALPMVAFSDRAKQAPLYIAAKEQRLDALMAEYYRLLYVALTRACETLHVFGTSQRQDASADPDSWYSCIASAMKTLGATDEAGSLVYADAARTTMPSESMNEDTAALFSPAWLHAPMPPQPLTDVASAIRNGDAYRAPVRNDARARGVRLHRLLELLRAEMQDAEIEAWLNYLCPDWSAAECQKALRDVLRLYHQEPWLWQGKRYREAPIAGWITDGAGIRHHVSVQMDLLIETPQELLLLDYKTGARDSISPSVFPENYRDQLTMYRTLLQSIYPEHTIRAGLVWTSTPEVQWLET
jgi:ATP-dependent helicase/nuclease subunit A